MKYVLDSSVAFKWFVPEVDSDRAIRLREDLRNAVHDLLAPDIFAVEMAHALTRAERQGRITAAEGSQAMHDTLLTLPPVHPFLPMLTSAYAISSATRVGVYDCLYVALAERESCEFVTADDKLVTNLQAQYAFIVALSSLP